MIKLSDYKKCTQRIWKVPVKDVEAPNEAKCLLAMLRFTRAAEKKGYLSGPVEEEEL
ncbi:MAG: hypothetical protein IJM83_01325 [Firmicutes bacterium]|nr:hypothetical protein [Bacillota bacterium]